MRRSSSTTAAVMVAGALRIPASSSGTSSRPGDGDGQTSGNTDQSAEVKPAKEDVGWRKIVRNFTPS